MIVLDTPVFTTLAGSTPAGGGLHDSGSRLSHLTALDGEALTALLRELCAEGSLPREQLRAMVEAAESVPTAGLRRTA